MSRIVVWIAIAVLTAPAIEAQKFEVAVIRPNTDGPMGGSWRGLIHGLFRAGNATPRQVLAAAFGVTEGRIEGPGWLDEERFDFEAKSPEGVPDGALKPMLRALMEDRFRLQSHIVKREMPVYELVVARGGPRMAIFPAEALQPPGTDVRGAAAMAGRVTMDQLADMLSRPAGRPVLDKTGLAEEYNIVLKYAPSLARPSANNPEFPLPDLFTAVQEQLGLRLLPARAELDVVVVDRMERMPTEN